MCVCVCEKKREREREKSSYTSLDDVTAGENRMSDCFGQLYDIIYIYIYTYIDELVITHTTLENDSNYYLVRITYLIIRTSVQTITDPLKEKKNKYYCV